MKKALLTGITGQDGAYLAQLLLKKNYKVFGLVRPESKLSIKNLEYLGIKDQVEFVEGDLANENSLIDAVKQIKPDEVYNLAAQSFVGNSWKIPVETAEVNAMGTLKLLNAVKIFSPESKYYQATTSEIFGEPLKKGIHDEETPFKPKSPYAISKLFAYWIVHTYKVSFDMFAVNGILFNHESPLRGEEFVTRKISQGVARIKLGLSDSISLGNLESRRDWGFAGDYVEAMWLMLQQEKPDNFIISTGETHSIRDFLDTAFKYVGIDDWQPYVIQDPKFMRPVELNVLQGSNSKAKKVLGWQTKVKFHELVEMMVEADLKRLK